MENLTATSVSAVTAMRAEQANFDSRRKQAGSPAAKPSNQMMPKVKRSEREADYSSSSSA
jgi:hypothetical protein